MAKDVSVNVSIHVEGRVIDLRVPRMVTKIHLKRVIVEALSMMKIKLPPRFELNFICKPVEMSDAIILDSYAIGDGDQIEIVTKKDKEQKKVEKI